MEQHQELIDARLSLLHRLHVASLGADAVPLGAPLPDQLATSAAESAAAALTPADEAMIVQLTQAVDDLTEGLARLQVDHEFWRGRAERAHRLGRHLGLAADLLEGGPWDWWRLGRTWWRLPSAGGLGLPSPSLRSLIILPSQRARLLAPVIDLLASLLGQLVEAAGAVLLAVSAGRQPQSDTWVAVRDAVHTACRRLGVPPPSSSSGGGDLRAAVQALLRQLLADTAIARARPAYQRNWLRFAVTGVAVAASVRYVVTHHASLLGLARTSYANLRTFVLEHVILPGREIFGEVFGGQRMTVADKSALEDARASLGRMLTDFYGRLEAKGKRGLSEGLAQEDLQQLARQLDMRPASERFAVESATPIVGFLTGDLLEALLIQVALLKKELLSALSAMDAILAENRVNFAVAASLPAFLVSYGLLSTGSFLWRSATAPADTADARQRILFCVRDIIRLLDCASGAGSPAGSTGSGRDRLDASTLAKLHAAARRLFVALRDQRDMISFNDSRRHLEDVSDALTPGTSLEARRAAIMRVAQFRFFEKSRFPFIAY